MLLEKLTWLVPECWQQAAVCLHWLLRRSSTPITAFCQLRVDHEVRIEYCPLTSGDTQLGAAVEQTNITILEDTAGQTSEEAAGNVGAVTGLLDGVAAAELEVLAARVTSLADSDIVADTSSATLGTSNDASGENKSGSDGETHFDGWLKECLTKRPVDEAGKAEEKVGDVRDRESALY